MSELQRELSTVDVSRRYTELYKTLRREYTERRMPLSGTFELTPHCTLDCKMCYVHSAAGNYPGRVLSGDEWIAVIDRAVDAGMMYACLTGGECMVHPDFRRIYTHLKQRGVFVSILSNGTLVDESIAQLFRQLPPRSIRITVYGSSPAGYDAVAGNPDAFYKVDRAFDLLHEAGVITDISITVSRYNYTDFENILLYAKSKPHANLQIDCEMSPARDETGHKFEDFCLSIEQQTEIWKTFYRHNGTPVNEECDELPIDPASDNFSEELRSYKGVPCAAGRCAFTISYNGIIKPCNKLNLATASVLEQDFMAAWSVINTAAVEYTRSDECLNCKHISHCGFCPGQYSANTHGINGLPGITPCNIKQRTLQYTLSKSRR